MFFQKFHVLLSDGIEPVMDPKSQGMTFSFACSYAFEILVYPSSDFSDGHVVRSKNSGQLGVRHGTAVGM